MRAALLCLCAVVGGSSGAAAGAAVEGLGVQVDPVHNRFVDAAGRTVLLRGIVQMADTPGPWLNSSQIDTLAAYGFTVVRLGFVWHLYEVAPGEFNESYMDDLADLASALAARGIRTVIDSHQDWLSPLYCMGRGLPAFYALPDADPAYLKGGARAYPRPLHDPTYAAADPAGAAAPFGQVDAATCGALFAHGWPFSYDTYAVQRAMQRVYDDDGGLLSRYAAMWERVARRFRGVAGAAFYEIFNEPWLGDTFADPSLLAPGAADAANVERLNAAVHRAVRRADNASVLLFEPAVSGNNSFATGLRTGPGGAGWEGRQAFSYHMYCPGAIMGAGVTSCPAGDPGLDLPHVFGLRAGDVRRLRTAGFLSEFGAVIEDGDGVAYLNATLAAADELLHAWTYYQFVVSPDPARPNWEAKYLVRAYPRAVAGVVTSLRYDAASANMTLSFAPDAAAAGATEIFLSRRYTYPRGAGWAVSPEGSLHGAYSGDVLSLHRAPGRVLDGGEVHVRVWPL